MVLKGFLTLFALIFAALLSGFASPSHKQFNAIPFDEIKNAYQLRKIDIPDMDFIHRISNNEEVGFIGCHGNSLDYMIFQDIIRMVMEEIVNLPIRNDFQFLGVPLDPTHEIQNKEKLISVLTEYKHPGRILNKSTFPLNFSIWDNYNRVGMNTLEYFAKNESVNPLGYQKRLQWLFLTLGIQLREIDSLFREAKRHLNSRTGMILQVFDISQETYAFSKMIAYPSYPEGYISNNVTVDEFFLNDQFITPYPHEVRLLLNSHETLNPNSPLKIVRYVDNPNLLKFQAMLREKIKCLHFNKIRANDYREQLKKVWNIQ